jgi:catechol 2,3-dioxygenase-like lactoylglutathione lyase family enzyme
MTAQPETAQPNFILLYVDSPKASGDFYTSLLGREPVETSPTFVMFALGGGLMLGLWSRHTVEPAPATKGGGSEIGIAVGNPAAVDATCAAWKAHGVSIIQEPTEMDFGRTFVGLDPDGHRVRVFAPPSDQGAPRAGGQ